MCSISGFIASRPIAATLAKDLAKSLLFYGAGRGNQSTGIYVNDRTFKRAVDVERFVDTTEFHNLFDKPVRLMLGHNRFPTCGGRGDEQAQPFEVDSTVTIHNGMLMDMAGLKRQWVIEKPTGVDSELITHFVAQYGVKSLPAFLDSTGTSPSAIAAVHDGSLFLMRSRNPTSYIRLTLRDKTEMLVFASTGAILLNAIRHVWLIRDLYPIETEEGRLLRVEPDGVTAIGKPLEKPKPKLEVWRGHGDYYKGYRDYYQYNDDDQLAHLRTKKDDDKVSVPHTKKCKCNDCKTQKRLDRIARKAADDAKWAERVKEAHERDGGK